MNRPTSYCEREAFLLDACRGRRVLHLGCIGGEYNPADARVQSLRESLHWRLSEIADVVGVDISADVIERIRREALIDNIVVGDVQALAKLGLEGSFDRVVAGDIIEHISNPGLMLDGIRSLCAADARVLITTPNPFGLPRYARFLLGRFRENHEHVMAFNIANLEQLLARHGFAVEAVHTCFQARARRGGLGFWLGRRLLAAAPALGGTILVVARPEAG